jgi:hypothetical protein
MWGTPKDLQLPERPEVSKRHSPGLSDRAARDGHLGERATAGQWTPQPDSHTQALAGNHRYVGGVELVMRLVAVALLWLGLAVGCSSGADTSSSARTSTSDPSAIGHFDNGVLAFDFPARWEHQDLTSIPSTFVSYLGYFSSMTLHDPCTTTSVANGSQVTCGDPIEALEPGAALVTWANVGFPTAAGEPEIASPNTTISGQTARVDVQDGGDCARLGADKTITADIERPGGNHYRMVACLRGPDLAQAQTAVEQMLQSVRITG